MKKILLIIGGILLIPVAIVVAVIAIPSVEVSELQNIGVVRELDDAQTLDMNLLMHSGELTVSSVGGYLVNAEFEFNVEAWHPTVDYEVVGSVGKLDIENPEQRYFNHSGVNTVNRWDVRLNNDLSLNVDAVIGAGDANFDMRELNPTDIEIDAGAGDVTLDLRGDWSHDIHVDIDASVGQVHVLVSDEMRVQASVTELIGSISTSGFTEIDDTYVSEFGTRTDATIYLNINKGIGDVTLQVDNIE